MNSLALNTHAFVKRLKAVNMTEEQAEVIVDGINAARDSDLANLATKADITRLEAATKADIANLAAFTKADIARLEAATKADIANLAAFTKADIARLEAATKADIANLAASTKSDIARLEAATKADLKELELRMDAKFEKVTGEITLLKWMMGLVIAGILALILKAYFPL